MALDSFFTEAIDEAKKSALLKSKERGRQFKEDQRLKRDIAEKQVGAGRAAGQFGIAGEKNKLARDIAEKQSGVGTAGFGAAELPSQTASERLALDRDIAGKQFGVGGDPFATGLASFGLEGAREGTKRLRDVGELDVQRALVPSEKLRPLVSLAESAMRIFTDPTTRPQRKAPKGTVDAQGNPVEFEDQPFGEFFLEMLQGLQGRGEGRPGDDTLRSLFR
jgi:hypothetical protein